MTENNRPAADGRACAFLPGGEPAAVLVGHILPREDGVPGTVVRISHETAHGYEEAERPLLDRFVPLQPWSSAVEIMESIGSGEQALNAMVDAGVLLQLPGRVTVEEFNTVFSGLKLITLNDAAVHSRIDGISADLVCGDGTLTVSQNLWEMLVISRLRAGKPPWNKDLPAALEHSAGGDRTLLERLTAETVSVLAPMINSGTAALIRID